MSRCPWMTAVLVVMSVALAQPALAGSGRGPAPSEPGPLVEIGIRADPMSSLLSVIRRPTRAGNDASFSVVSVTCVNCGISCPPRSRTIRVVLKAMAPVAAGSGVAALTSGNYTVTTVSQSTREPLAVGEQVTIDITGDVISCSSWFNVWFSLCDTAPASWTDPLPAQRDGGGVARGPAHRQRADPGRHVPDGLAGR